MTISYVTIAMKFCARSVRETGCENGGELFGAQAEVQENGDGTPTPLVNEDENEHIYDECE